MSRFPLLSASGCSLIRPGLPVGLKTRAVLSILELVLVNASNPEQVRQALEMLDAARVEAVNVLTSPVFANVREIAS